MTYSILSGACLSAGVWLAGQACAAGCADNLIENGGFELGEQGWALSAGEITTSGRTGQASLRYQNSDPDRYHTMTQQLRVKPGQALDFGVWVNGADLQGDADDRGAGIFVESYDADGRYLAGSHPQGVVGTGDWQPVAGRFLVPARAAEVTLGVYFRRGTSGRAEFDDVYACLQPTAPVLYQVRADDAMALSTVFMPDKQPVQVDSTLLNSRGEAVKHDRRHYHIEGEQPVVFALPATLSAGEYRLQQRVTAQDSQLSRSSAMPISISSRPPKVALDAQGYTLKDGKRFFPLGIYMYAGMATDEHLARIRAAGFNTLLDYDYGVSKDPAGYFRKAQQHDLQVIYSVKDFYAGTQFAPETHLSYPALTAAYVEKLKHQPNLLAWYINDELGLEYVPQIEAKHLQIKQRDPDHLTFQVVDRAGALDSYFNSSDVLASDPYPVGKDNDLTRTLLYARLTKMAARQAKGAWIVTQIMDHAAYSPGRKPHQPSEAEMRNQAWLGLIGGAKGILFYSYTDLFYKRNRGTFRQQEFDGIWQGVAKVAQEIVSFTPYLLSGESLMLYGNNTAIPARLFIDGGRGLVLVVNPYYRPMSVRFALPAGWQWQEPQGAELALPSMGSMALWVQRQTTEKDRQ